MRTMATTIAMLVLTGTYTQGHDIYSALKDNHGQSCCNETDCRPANYRVTAAGVEMLLDGEWVHLHPLRDPAARALLNKTGRRGLGQAKAAVKRDITSNLRDLTVIAIIAGASVILAISTDNSFFAPVFAAEAFAAVYLAIWIGNARS